MRIPFRGTQGRNKSLTEQVERDETNNWVLQSCHLWITDDFWKRKSAEWHEEEQRLLMSIGELDEAKPDRLLDGVRLLELANKAHFLYLP